MYAYLVAIKYHLLRYYFTFFIVLSSLSMFSYAYVIQISKSAWGFSIKLRLEGC